MTRILCHLLLALALISSGVISSGVIANGLAGSVAGAANHSQHETAVAAAKADAAPTCHDGWQAPVAQPDAPAPVPLDCCEGGGCFCACVHSALAVLESPALRGASRFRAVPAFAWRPLRPNLTRVPLFRPPIA